MKVLKILDAPDRNPTIDVFRALATLAVVLYHFHFTVYMGFLGVDLFFVISGFLVGGLLIRDFKNGTPIRFGQFFLRRGFKIWPSYYVFLLLGGIAATILFRKSDPGYLPSNWWRYIFFYENYSIQPDEWTFSHAWSLCVEEHFYIFLPVIFLLIQRFGNFRILVTTICALIVAGELSKVLTYLFTEKKDTYFVTHNRIDALAWGVLLQIIISYTDWIKMYKHKLATFFIMLILLVGMLRVYFMMPDIAQKTFFHSFIPIIFSVMIGSLYFIDLSFLKPLRIMGYYSYNWYLWHPITAATVWKFLGDGPGALVIYLLGSFLLAVLFTHLIETPFLRMRKKILASRATQRTPIERVGSY